MTDDPRRLSQAKQREAADPTVSVALRAAAGAGKTRTLIDRFIRLCVEDSPSRCHPRAILAITFTRKAAVEIQQRLLGRATKMALASEQSLRADLENLFAGRGHPAPSRHEIQRAAELYELLLEDLSGLKIGTIHSFCQLILNRFAAEAGLDPNFTVQENRQELVEEALDQIELLIAGDEDLTAAAQNVGKNPQSVRKILSDFFQQQMRVERWVDRLARRQGEDSLGSAGAARLDHWPAMCMELRSFLWPERDLTEDPTPAHFLPELAIALEQLATAGIAGVRTEMADDLDKVLSGNLDKLQSGCQQVLASIPTAPAADVWAKARLLFLTKAGQIRVQTKKRDEVLKTRFQASVLQQAVEVLSVLQAAGYCELYTNNRDLLRLGLTVLGLYDNLKRRDRVVDFQDLEGMACRLMGEEARAVSLLYRLDDAICHILLDETQDTNFNQWEILKPFLMEFLSGDNDQQRRTVFLVGDVKQSIYGFRGAVPEIFNQARVLLQRFEQRDLELPTNFRSLPHLVDSVGCLFETQALAGAWEQDERDNVRQHVSRTEDAGTVVVLDPYEATDQATDPATEDDRSAQQQAADAALAIVTHLKNGWPTWDDQGEEPQERPLRWDDFLLLCRSRTDIDIYEKVFQGAGIPYQRPGRGMLAASREVQDILALLRWLTYPDDDVALATVLRSPLMRIPEPEFQAVLAGRGVMKQDSGGKFLPLRSLWRTLLADPDNEVTAGAVHLLTEWRKHVGREHIHDLLRRIYREGQVLSKYELACGEQSRHNLLRLMDLTLGAEVAGTPTVRSLAELVARAGRQGGQEEGTLPPGEGEGRVGFMTVHGAKGLEAPVVLLVDADREGGRISPVVPLVAGSSSTPLLFGVKADLQNGWQLPQEIPWRQHPLQLAATVANQQARCEETNLLYVAMTRARDRLFILGGDKGKDGSPLRQVQAAAEAGQCRQVCRDDPPWLERPPQAAKFEDYGSGGQISGREHIRRWTPPVLASPYQVVTPSAEEAPVMSGIGLGQPDQPTGPKLLGAEKARLRGLEVHAWLQAAADAGSMPEGQGAAWAEAAAIFTDPKLNWVFHPQKIGGRGLSEVPVIHRRPAGSDGKREERLTGVIDRLILRDDRIDIIDYKTDRSESDPGRLAGLVEHYRPQLTAYAEAVAAMSFGKPIHSWLLLTDPELASGRLVEITD